MIIDWKLLLRGVLPFLAFSSLTVRVSAAKDKSSGVSTSSAVISTCPAKTANYITHNLPQLCLTSSRTGPTNATTTETTEGITSDMTDHASININTTLTSSLASTTTTISIRQSMTHISTVHSTESPTQYVSVIDQGTEVEEAESDLGNAKFLSFEDWKKQNLAKNGQAEHIGKNRANDNVEVRRKLAPDPAVLDSLGDDAEIDLDFSAFAAEKPGVLAPSQRETSVPESSEDVGRESPASVSARSRSKDAGTTCKERFNYASFDCAATVLKTNPQAKGSNAVLGENKDSYMLNECSADSKFLVLELCNDIYIDTIALANFEFFSSMFRTFRVSVSDKYPVKSEKWKTLGTFEARNSREVQAFLVENPLIWARYLRIEFLSHYGNEYYCPLSLIRVHGTTMMEDYKHDLESLHSDDDEDEEGTSNAAPDEERLVPDAIAQILVEEEETKAQAGAQEQAGDECVGATTRYPGEDQTSVVGSNSTYIQAGTSPYHRTAETMLQMELLFTHNEPICLTLEDADDEAVNATAGTSSSTVVASNDATSVIAHTKSDKMSPVPVVDSSRTVLPTQSSVTDSVKPFVNVNMTAETKQPSNSSTLVQAPKATNATQAENTKATASSTQPAAASPTMQESFFKSVQKRLQMLESNSSLSLQYIEEQSRNLRDAFSRVEQRQLAKTTTFLDYLNSTVLNELRDFRQQYDHLWQATVIELETQREQYQEEVLTINSRLAVLADEVIFQKRMSILQTVLVLLCLGLVLFSRGAMNNYLELPIVQNMLARSASLRMLTPQSPSESPATTRPNSSHKQHPPHGILKHHQREISVDSVEGPSSPIFAYSPPTPTSFEGASDVEEANEVPVLESSMADPETIERPSSSPPMLPGSEENISIDWQDTVVQPVRRSIIDEHELRPTSVKFGEATHPVKHLSFQLPDG